ncbi:MAG: SLBB domain-containing protein [Leptolyngbyaceae bacterium]|nr:SLBB domain-containing protein [Leptolyngbyaceae bacterium]
MKNPLFVYSKIQQSIGGLALSSLITLSCWQFPAQAQTTSPGQVVVPAQTTSPEPALPSQPKIPSLTPKPRGVLPLKTPTPAPVSIEDGYTLGSGDSLKIDVFNVPEYSGQLQVLSDGTLNLPLVGTVSVQGMTLKQAASEISFRYTRFLKRPIVTLTLLSARPLNVAMAGEVNRPGSYTLGVSAAGASGGSPTLTRALQQAGGITQSADIRQIQVRRPRPRNTGPDQVITVNLWQLLQTGDLRQDLLLRDGDSIFIPTSQDINIAEANQLAAASFAPNEAQPFKVAVIGEVNRPGPHIIGGAGGAASTSTGTAGLTVAKGKNPTVTTAIQIAGGITQSADIRQIKVRRLTKGGTERIITIDLWKLLQEGDLRQDLPLQEGDTIEIATARTLSPSEATGLANASFSPDRITVNVVGEVGKPGAVQVPPNTPLNQALLAAGGFNNRAQQGSVDLVRLNPNGTVSRQTIAVDFAQGISEGNNPALRNNDTILVSKSGVVGFTDTLGLLTAPFTGIFSVFRLLGL